MSVPGGVPAPGGGACSMVGRGGVLLPGGIPVCTEADPPSVDRFLDKRL